MTTNPRDVRLACWAKQRAEHETPFGKVPTGPVVPPRTIRHYRTRPQ